MLGNGGCILNEQENFWLQIEREYIDANSNFDKTLGVKAWLTMLNKIPLQNIKTVLECGSNIGRNINYLNEVLPQASKSIIELSEKAYHIVKEKYQISHSFLGSIQDAVFKNDFDLVFTSGVLIHIHPSELLRTMSKLYEFSNKYILIGEYFSRQDVSIEYRNQTNKLFKSNFGKTMIDNFELKLIDYGFLWGYEFDKAGFDDITFWLFEKPA